ncbi:MAG TPA: hypothetical protein VGM54_09940 [Chthoniobacter sp.]|jgi:hypothetical protein
MGDLRLHVDTRRFNVALGEFAAYSKKSGLEVLLDQSRLFVQKAIGLTPPGKGKANAAARKRGEDAIRDDLHRIFKPKDRSYLEYLERIAGTNQVVSNVLRKKDGTPYLIDFDVILQGRDSLVPFHLAHRSQVTGHVFQVNRDVTTGRRKIDQGRGDIAFVPRENYAWFERRVLARVGLLAGGWNRSAKRLGARVPAWIARHGEDRGAVTVTAGSEGVMRVTMENDVRFASQVAGLQSRIQQAVDWQARAMERRLEYFKEHAGRRAGFR